MAAYALWEDGRPLDKQEILEVVDGCMNERLESIEERPRSRDARQLSLTCQQVLYEVYHESRANGGIGDAEDVLRNENIKQAIGRLPESVRQLARDILVCAHGRIAEASGEQ